MRSCEQVRPRLLPHLARRALRRGCGAAPGIQPAVVARRLLHHPRHLARFLRPSQRAPPPRGPAAVRRAPHALSACEVAGQGAHASRLRRVCLPVPVPRLAAAPGDPRLPHRAARPLPRPPRARGGARSSMPPQPSDPAPLASLDPCPAPSEVLDFSPPSLRLSPPRSCSSLCAPSPSMSTAWDTSADSRCLTSSGTATRATAPPSRARPRTARATARWRGRTWT